MARGLALPATVSSHQCIILLGERPILQPDILFEMDPLFTVRPAILLLGGDFPDGWTAGLAAQPANTADALAALESGQPAILIARMALLDGPLGRALAQAQGAESTLVLVPEAGLGDQAGLDAAGALLDLPGLVFLAPDTADADARAMIGGLADRLADRLARPRGVADGSMDMAAGFRLEALRQDAERVARALAELATAQPESAEAARPVTAQRIRQHLKARRARAQFFGADLFADPAWDMLLDLAAARLEGQRVSVSSLCIAAAVPTTTALRWIKTLVDRGLLGREADPEDGRRAFISLSAAAVDVLEPCLDHVLNYPGQ